MSARDPLPRLISELWVDSGRLPVRLEDVDCCTDKKTMCFFMRDICDELLSCEGLLPQMIELPTWAVTLLENLVNADEPYLTFPIENVGPHDLYRHLPSWEKVIYLVPYGVDPESLTDLTKDAYHAMLSLIDEVGTLGSPVANIDDIP